MAKNYLAGVFGKQAVSTPVTVQTQQHQVRNEAFETLARTLYRLRVTSDQEVDPVFGFDDLLRSIRFMVFPSKADSGQLVLTAPERMKMDCL